MNSFKKLAVLGILFINLNLFSQDRNWTIKTTKDEKTTVKYDIEKENGGTHMFYIATQTVNTSISELADYFSKSSNHKNFLENTPKSEEVEKISDNEWITYYFFDAPWPMPNSDVVVKFKKTKKDNKIFFTANAINNDYKESDVERLSTYTFIYEFEKIDEQNTKITINANFISVGSVPNFLVKTWFPKGPAKIISNLSSKKVSLD
ncbi:hypothetical protein [Polaribacter sp. Asnod6-C07]|uniref:hypothetical protein n=1 Tax=Polaribacter sp. Asnod6-C07 TaxID=3160582 RepID=UPI003866C7D1